MSITYRPATAMDIIEARSTFTRVRFRHFVHEIGDHRTETGVRHQQYSSAKMHVIDGVPFVQHQGELVELTAELATLDRDDVDVSFLYDLRVKSEYLPPA